MVINSRMLRTILIEFSGNQLPAANRLVLIFVPSHVTTRDCFWYNFPEGVSSLSLSLSLSHHIDGNNLNDKIMINPLDIYQD